MGHLEHALQEAPGFVMAHTLQAYLSLGSRDPAAVRAAQPALARAAALPANDLERRHLAAITAVLADDYEAAKATLGELLNIAPRDALALQVAHTWDYVTGDTARMAARVGSVLPAWSSGMAGYPTVLAMHGFALEECGDHARAEQAARAALALDPSNARAHHVMAHVFEMTDRPEAGEQWLRDHEPFWSLDTVVATHCWWHLGLFQMSQGRADGALETYDRHIRRAESNAAVSDLIDASALLWRIRLAGAAAGERWAELADAWDAHIDDRFCSFTDLHGMLAFVGSGDAVRARRLERSLLASHALPTRHGRTARVVGLPACRGLMAFGRDDPMLAITLLVRLPAFSYRLGGSHAQRDVLSLTC